MNENIDPVDVITLADLSWADFIKNRAILRITSSKTRERLDFLNHSLLPRIRAGDLSEKLIGSLLHVVLLTYPRYNDRESRATVLTVLKELNNWNSEAFLKSFVPLLAKEIDKLNKKSSDGIYTTSSTYRFVLLTWINSMITFTLTSVSSESFIMWKSLIDLQAILLDSLVNEKEKRKSVTRSAVVDVRRCVRKNYTHIPAIINHLTQSKKGSASFPNAVLLGTVIDCALRLKKNNDRAFVDNAKDDIIQFYLTSIASSKIPVPTQTADAFHDFIHCTVVEQDFQEKFIPTLEKLLLRAPEIILNVLISTIKALGFDTSVVFKNHFLESLLGHVRSTNKLVQSVAIDMLHIFLEKSQKSEVVIEIGKQMIHYLNAGKVTNPEHRGIIIQAIGHVDKSPAVARTIVEDLLPIISKENSEQSLAKAIDTLISHAELLINNEKEKADLDKIALAVFEGLSSSKFAVRKAWTIAIGRITWNIIQEPTDFLRDIIKKCLIPLISTLDKIQSNPLVFPGGPIEGYITIAIVEGRTKKWHDKEIDDLLRTKKLTQNILATTPKLSFWLWDKVYCKITNYEEGLWFIRSMEGFLFGENEIALEKKELRILLATAYIFLITASPDFHTRREAYDSLVRCNKYNPKRMGTIIREGMNQWVFHLEKNVKDSTAHLASTFSQSDASVNAYQLSRVLTAITTFSETIEKGLIENLLVELILLAHHPAIVSPTNKYNWISLAQRARLNPGNLVEVYHNRLAELIFENIKFGNESENFYKAAMSTVSTLVFISAETTVPLFLAQSKNDLDSQLLQNIGDQEIGIWKTPENVLFVDVLKRNKQKIVENRNRKDYNTEKWEQEIRDEIAKKKGAETRKLTKDEQAAVNAQLLKESNVRKQVQEVYFRFTRGLDLVHFLITGNLQALENHIAELMHILIFAVKNASVLIGDKGIDTFLNLGIWTSENIAPIRTSIGLATIRIMEAQEIQEKWLEEPLGSLITRVLYRLRVITERTRLSPASFAYCFPLIYQVIKKGGSVYKDDTNKDSELSMEQVAMGLDIISFHSTIGNSSLIPRGEVIEALMHVIKEFPKLAKTAKSALIDLCQAIGDTAKEREIEILLDGLLCSQPFVRNACLLALEYLDLTDNDFEKELWITRFDGDITNAKLAVTLWEDNGMDVESNYATELLPLLIHPEHYVRITTSKSIGTAVKYFPETISETLTVLYNLYSEKTLALKPDYNEFGVIIPESLNKKDKWEERIGVGLALSTLASSMTSSDLLPFFEFLINREAVGDVHPEVRQKMLEAGLAVVDAHGGENVTSLMPVFEKYLDTPAPDSETHDRIRESVVIWFGALARHLHPTDQRIPVVIDKLLETLKTPSETVQVAVGDCLPPLIKAIKNSAPDLINGLLNRLYHDEKYAERRGAAYGLSGVIKGTGISALKDCNVMNSLKENIGNKKDYKCRQGALFAFETLSQGLGRLFEPYVIQILPLLLTAFGDTNPDIREAASETARVIMSKISGHCVKLILPSILSGLDDRQWRTKKGSVELLGTMAFCAPKQLSISLPTIVPRLTDVLTDSHTHVQAAANEALLHFGEVISNPEIKELVPILLQALSDPDKNTNAALDALLETAFVHYIDGPSLALVMPILERGLKERSTDVKKKSSQIVGNMASLTDFKDLIPYLERLLPGLKEVLVDPVPEARSTAAKALGTLVERLGEDKFPTLVTELVNTLKSDTSGVDRQGAAQGLSEVLAGLGLERLDGLLPDIVTNSESPKSYVREGFISLLIYLPATFGLRFQPYLGRIIPPILAGLADDSEYVRDASLRAGQMIVANYATKAVDLLLPELERGLFDDNWRIRQSSVQLMGDLLYRITGISGKSEELEGDEDETGGTEASRKALLEVLGKERRDRVLAALYIVRQDVSGILRQASLHVWKAIVSNTPRTIKDILLVMMGMIIQNLAAPSYERRQVAARTLGELVRKLGEGVLTEIIPILEKGLESTEAETRQGVCVGLNEIMSTASRLHIIEYVDSLVPAVRRALVDESGEVREAAAQAFDTLHQHVGPKAIDEILPSLLNSLQSGENSDYALEALKEIMAVRANVVFPVLIPTLITIPITSFNARALASLVSVAGSALNKRLTSILNALVISLSIEKDEATIAELQETERALLLSIDNAEGLHTLMTMLFETVKSEDPSKRSGSCDIITIFCSESKMDYSRYISDWIRVLVSLLDDRVQKVVKSAWDALNAVTKSVKKDDLEQLVIPVRRAVKVVGVPGVDLPGFCLPKGISPILPIFLQGLMYGTPEIREQAALGIGDLIQRTSADAIRPFVTPITGPLIRIIGDRYPYQVKAAILQTLSLLLIKVPTLLKPFLPQLQRTFVKSLTDPSSGLVRSRAASALGILISLQSRVDPLVSELITGIKTCEPNVREIMMNALETVVDKAGSTMGDMSKKSVVALVVDGLNDNSEGMLVAASRILGSFFKHITLDEARKILKTHIISNARISYGALLGINAILTQTPEVFDDLGFTDDLIEIISNSADNNQPAIANTAILAAGKMLLTQLYQSEDLIDRLVRALVNNIKEPSTGMGETKRLALTVFRGVGRKYPAILEKSLPLIIPPMIACARDRNGAVKLAAETALVYTLQLLDGETILQQYLAKTDPQTSKSIIEFIKRNMSKVMSQEKEWIEESSNNREENEDAEIWQVGSVGNSVGFDEE